MHALMEALVAPVLWLSISRSAENGRKGRDFQVWSAEGARLLSARAHDWGRDIAVRQHGTGTEPPLLLLRRRRLFPVTGVVDILGPRSERIGVVRRNLSFAPASGSLHGRFRDTRTVRGRTGEAVLATVVDTILSGEGNSEVSGPRDYRCEINGTQAGVLTPAALPFPSEQAGEPSAAARALKRMLPRSLGERLVTPRPPRGWKLEWLREAPPCDPRVVIGAVLFTLELHQWR